MNKKDLVEWLKCVDDDTEILIGEFDNYGDRISDRADKISNIWLISDEKPYVILGHICYIWR